MFASPHRLRIQLRHKPGTPVRKNLSSWPAFPILIDYGKGIAHRNEDNIITALEHANPVSALSLTAMITQLV